MNNKTSSIRGIISISFIILMVSTLLTIGYIIFSSWKESSENIILKMENASNKDILKKIEELIYLPYTLNAINHNVLENEIVDMSNETERDAFFASIVESSDENIYSISYGLENGDYYGARRNENGDIQIYKSNNETNGHSQYYSITEDLTEGQFVEDAGQFDPRTRPWYSLAKEAGKPIFSPLYKHFVKDDLVLTSAYPIYNREGIFQGVLGTRITLSSLNDYLKEILADRSATAYVIERTTGELVANSLDLQSFQSLSDGTFKRISIDTIDDKDVLEAYELYKSTDETKVIKKTNEGNLHIKLTEYKLDGVDWLIITTIPESQLTSQINQNITTAILLSIMAMLISMIIYKKVTDIILKPIHNLIWSAEKFSQGDLLHRAEIYKNDEIGKLSRVFNNMAEQLYKHINHLEEKVKERTTEIEKTNKELSAAKIEADKANKAKSEFLANMSHEIRTPLHAVIGLSEMLQTTIKDEQQQNYIKTINNAGNSLLLIINDILDLSKIEAGKMEVQYKPIKLHAIFKEIETIFMQKIQQKEMTFLIDFPSDIPETILLDEVRIRQILLNLVGNAIKFTEKGYVKLSIEAKPSNTGNRALIDLHLSVQDTGIGIPETERERIFEAFTQISGQSIKKYGGTGLGLSITKKLVELMNGKISVESEVSKGSEFHIEFKNVRIADCVLLPNEMPPAAYKKDQFVDTTILVVDDIENNRYLLKEYLSKAGIRVLLAENGFEALKVCEFEKPDLIITDLVMPVINGVELSRTLRENPQTAHIPIIGISADLPKDHPFDGFLLKPVTIDEVYSQISPFIQKKTVSNQSGFLYHLNANMDKDTLSPEVAAAIKEQLNPLLKKLETSIIISTVKRLAQLLISLGDEHQSELLTFLGKELMSYAECYDIIHIKLTLKSIEKILVKEH
ncbi:hybrid sensor histidine kinase/response regulator [Niallia endozanthoxylica]|uniref:Circadian input-output histidine kinase CikA n=1 Tax=Niallia endozanthoxylica TaxID=2036016 RepID=A0A5J5I8H9_9BACI|nr:hybrid sensor histidine kinase/response regulator [Niallia endozanthoxylica]KAA9032420.1 response regulator [Niallia endozanthoxylica]